MRNGIVRACAAAFALSLFASCAYPHPGPFDGERFRGRIAYSADGNYNDEDDWAASPVALAILAACGVQEKLVHCDYNCILSKTNADWEKKHEFGVLGAAERYGYARSIFHNCQKELNAAIDSIRDAVNNSSADNPLYFIIAGPVEVPFLGVRRSDPDKRKFVYCISHNCWNDGYASGDLACLNKRAMIGLGVSWIQITDQNQFLSTSRYGRAARETEWRPWRWMRDSRDPNIRFLWDRMRATTRADCSDAGMAYFLVTGDERSEISKLRALLERRRAGSPIDPRTSIRLEAENFRDLENYRVEYRNDRSASQRISVMLGGAGRGHIGTLVDEPYMASRGRYDVDVRYYGSEPGGSRFQLSVNGARQGDSWSALSDKEGWKTRTIRGVEIRGGDDIAVEVQGGARDRGGLDYVELHLQREPLSPARLAAASSSSSRPPLDDPDALPGQVIVAGGRPGYLKYNGGGPVFLAGPDNPEDFLFQGDLQPDGVRSGGRQTEMIDRMIRAGVNAFHCQMFRMRRCNFKDEGDDTHCPFIRHDPSQPLNEKVLNQWDGWLDRLEAGGVIVHLEFYNDATDVERMGWTLDGQGRLHPDEKRWIEGVVNRFKRHKNIIWGIEESCNKLPGSRTAHFKKIGELIARADNHHHPIVQSFVVPDDPEGDFPPRGVMSDVYKGDPNIRLITWLHVPPHGDDFEKQHREYLKYHNRDAADFVVMKNETYHHPRRGSKSRRYMWSCAMTGTHALEAYHHADDASYENVLRDDGRIKTFMEQTDFYRMKPRDDLAAGSTRWVLANPGNSYIAYTYDASGPVGLKNLDAGRYDLKWFDPAAGRWVVQRGVSVSSGDALWSKPDAIGAEAALYVQRRDRGPKAPRPR